MNDVVSTSKAEAASLLRGCSLFAELGEPEIAEISDHSHWLSVEAGKVVVSKGDTGDDFDIVATGTLDAFHRKPQRTSDGRIYARRHRRDKMSALTR